MNHEKTPNAQNGSIPVKPTRDWIDKTSIICQIISSVFIAFIAVALPSTMNYLNSKNELRWKEAEQKRIERESERQNEIARLEMLSSFMDQLKSKDDEERKLGFLAIASLGDGALAVRLAALADFKPALDSLLPHAITTGDFQLAKVLLQAGADPNKEDLAGRNAAHIAAMGKDNIESMMSELIAAGVNIHAFDSHDKNPLMYAVESSSIQNVETLLSLGARPDEMNVRGRTAFSYLFNVTTHTQQYMHPLAETFSEEIARAMIRAGADIDAWHIYENNLLHFAAMKGWKEWIPVLLELGADVNYKNPQFNEDTILTEASSRLEEEFVEELLKNGADPNKPNGIRYNPLAAAILSDGSSHPLYNVYKNRGESFALRTVEILLEYGADPNWNDYHGTALHAAASSGKTDIMKLLIAHGADVNASSDNGMTPLMISVKEGRKEDVALLLSTGADVRAKDDYGDTVLFYAVEGAGSIPAPAGRPRPEVYREMIVLFLEEGLSPNERNHGGMTPYTNAVLNVDLGSVLILQSHGAKWEEPEGIVWKQNFDRYKESWRAVLALLCPKPF